jgi:hypothetical protein
VHGPQFDVLLINCVLRVTERLDLGTRIHLKRRGGRRSISNSVRPTQNLHLKPGLPTIGLGIALLELGIRFNDLRSRLSPDIRGRQYSPALRLVTGTHLPTRLNDC